MKRGAASPSRVGSFLFVLGVLSVLGTSFAIGVSAGRRWPGLLPSLGVAAGPGAAGPGRPAGGPTEAPADPSRGTAGLRPPAPPPVLTFYRELTAPLAAPPPRPERGERSTRSGGPAPEGARPDPAADGLPERRFTIQVGAFKTREQAETMRGKLADEGQDAYVTALDGSAGARFRVRVGAFATRDEARRVADRLSRERQLATYVTVR